MQLRQINITLTACLLIMLFFHILILIYGSTVDDFAPKHIFTTLFLINEDDMPGYVEFMYDQVSAYYGFIAVVLLVTDISKYAMPTFPITLIPYCISFFTFVYIISGKSRFSCILALLLTVFVMTAPLCGSHKINLWPHGISTVLIYSYVLLLYNTMLRGDPRYATVGLLAIFTLIFMSYNVAFYLLCILGMLLLISILISDALLIGYIKSSFLFSVVVLFGLSKFMYDTFLPKIADESVNSRSPIMDFIIRFFSFEEYVVTDLDMLLRGTPSIITNFYIIKYALYFIVILLSLVLIWKYKNSIYKNFRQPITLFVAMTIATFLYMCARYIVGQFPLAEISNILIYSFIIIGCFCGHSKYGKLRQIKTIQKLSVGILLILIIINIAVLSIGHDAGIVQKDNYDYIATSSNWLYKHYENTAHFPDHLTFAWSLITYYDYSQVVKIPKYLSVDDVIGMYLSKPIEENRLIVVNYRSDYNALTNWIWTKSFKSFRETVEANPSIKAKIYMYNEDISIILT